MFYCLLYTSESLTETTDRVGHDSLQERLGIIDDQIDDGTWNDMEQVIREIVPACDKKTHQVLCLTMLCLLYTSRCV